MLRRGFVTRAAIVVVMAWMIVLIAACSGGDGAPESAMSTPAETAIPRRAPAPLEAIDVLQLDTFPVQVRVVARGRFPDECTSVDQIRQERQGGTFLVYIDSVRSAGADCPANPIPFEEAFDLDLAGLPAGIYVVDVNGLQGTFKLQQDNVADEANAVLSGQVWQDLCSVSEQNGDVTPQPSPGCVDRGDGTFRGNGLRDVNEAGLGGVIVDLGAGACPASGLASTITDGDGAFLFSGLRAGTYCLSVAENDGLAGIIPAEGEWTVPADGLGWASVTLEPGGSQTDLSFGWSPVIRSDEVEFYFFEPGDDCTNKALFIADLTVPDDTLISAGETFTKTWRLQNLGSCTWDSTYSLIVVAGDAMGISNAAALSVTVPPGELGDLSVKLTAPTTPGIYRAEWKLMSPEGATFGIGPGSDRPFWLQVVVTADEASG